MNFDVFSFQIDFTQSQLFLMVQSMSSSVSGSPSSSSALIAAAVAAEHKDHHITRPPPVSSASFTYTPRSYLSIKAPCAYSSQPQLSLLSWSAENFPKMSGFSLPDLPQKIYARSVHFAYTCLRQYKITRSGQLWTQADRSLAL